MYETASSGHEHSRSASATFSRVVEILQEKLVIIRDDDTHAQSTAQEEQHETPDERVVGSAHQLPRVLGLRCGHGDELRADHSEGCLDHAGDKTEETTGVSWDEVFDERALVESVIARCLGGGGRYWILPVGETVSPMLWVASDHGDKGIANQSRHEEDLED